MSEHPWEQAGDGCECWVNPNPFTYYGIVEPGDALEYNPDCPKHGQRLIGIDRLGRRIYEDEEPPDDGSHEVTEEAHEWHDRLMFGDDG